MAQPVSKYGGVPVETNAVSKYGGVSVDSPITPGAPPAPYTANSPIQMQGEPGFWSRFGQALNPMPLLHHPLDALGGMLSPLADPSEAMMMGHTPLSQQVIQPVTNDIEAGNYAGAAGSLSGMALPWVVGAGLSHVDLPSAETMRRVGRGVVGAGKGAAEAFTSGRSTIPAAALGTVGHWVSGPQGAEVGAALGALPGTIRGAWEGMHSALNPIEAARPRVAPPPIRWNPPPVEPKMVAPPPLRGSSIPPVESPAPTVAPPPLRGNSYVEPKPPVSGTPTSAW